MNIWTIAALIALSFVLILFVLVWAVNFHPVDGQAEPVSCSVPAPSLKPGQQLKVMNYNVQFMAGKEYVFFFDVPDFSGSDTRPSPEAITRTIEGIAALINEVDPDIILLQEVDDGARRTDHEDQLARLLQLISPDYRCHTSLYYWKSKFVPHPKILGPVGLKMSVISKYQIDHAERVALPNLRVNPLVDQFTARRAILKAYLPVEGQADLVLMNTHLEAFVVGTNVMEEQVDKLNEELTALRDTGSLWILGGDFNLLGPGQYEELPDHQQQYYSPQSAMDEIYAKYQVLPALDQLTGSRPDEAYTYFGNDPRLSRPDRTIDYLVYSEGLELVDFHVRQRDALPLSDHLPLIAEFALKE